MDTAKIQDIHPIEQGDEQKSIHDILHLAASSVESIKAFLNELDKSITGDFREMIDHISQTKADIQSMDIKGSTSHTIPEAGHELHRVVEATEEATHTIMTCAETIMSTPSNNNPDYPDVVNENLMQIFEACSFQDITGQRINKVVETLEFVDHRLNKLAQFMGIEDTDQTAMRDETYFSEKAERKKNLILHGPAGNEASVSQADIDDMF